MTMAETLQQCLSCFLKIETLDTELKQRKALEGLTLGLDMITNI